MAQPTMQEVKTLLDRWEVAKIVDSLRVLAETVQNNDSHSRDSSVGTESEYHHMCAILHQFRAADLQDDGCDRTHSASVVSTAWAMLSKVAQYVNVLEHQSGDTGPPDLAFTQARPEADFQAGHARNWHQAGWSANSAGSIPHQNFNPPSPTSASLHGQYQQYRPAYSNIQEQRPSWNHEYSTPTYGSNDNYSYVPITVQANATSLPRGMHQQRHLLHAPSQPRRDPAFGALPHIYQSSAFEPVVMWPPGAVNGQPQVPPSSRNFQADTRSAARRPSAGVTPRKDESGKVRALYNTFKQPPKPKKFFRVGRVFMILWTEPLGDESLSETSQFTLPGLYGDWLHQKVRRFIVIGEAERHCLAIPISTYGNKGVSKQGLNKADHGIVYIGSKIPEPDKDELPARGELPMVEIAIRVDPDNPTEKLENKSRIHYSKVYTIEHKVKAKSVGMIHTRSLPDLLYQTKLVWSRTSSGLGQLGIEPGRRLDPEDEADGSRSSSTSTDPVDFQETAKGSIPDRSPSQPAVSLNV